MKKTTENKTDNLTQEIKELEILLAQKREQLNFLTSNTGKPNQPPSLNNSDSTPRKEEVMSLFQKLIIEKQLSGSNDKTLLNIKAENIEEICKSIVSSEESLQETLLSTSVLAVSVKRDGTIYYCNDYFARVTEFSVDELLGENLFEFLDFRDSLGQKITTAYNPENSFEVELKTKSGDDISIRFNTIPFQIIKDTPTSFTFIGEDITEQMMVTQALYETNALLQDIFDSSHDIIFIFDEKGQILFVNNTFKRVLGFSNEELETRLMFDFVAPDLKKKTYEILEKAKSKGELQNFETALINYSGKRVHLTGTLSSKREDDGRCIYRATFFDITEQQKVKKAQELYYGIAKLVEKGTHLNDLYHKFYLYLNEAIGIDSFLVVLKHEGENITIPFHINSDFGSEEPIHGLELAKDALILDRPMFMYEEVIQKLVTQRGLKSSSKIPRVWLGVPLVLDHTSKGIIVVQSYIDRKAHDKRDLELLTFISGQLASAIIRAKNEQQINNQKARLEAIFESGSHLMWSIERDGNLNRYNQNFLRRVHDYLNVRSYYKLNLFSELQERLSSDMSEWVQRYVNAFNGIIQQFEVKFISNTGEENWWDISLNPIKNSEGDTVEVSGVAHDITQKKITEIGLAESEEKFRNIFDSLLDVYFRVNMNGIITMVSPSVFELMGYSQLEIVGKHISEFYLNKRKLKYLIRKLLKEGYVKNFESRIFEVSNNPHNIISNFRLLYDSDGNPSHIEGVARDITELKNKTEELRAAKNLAERSLEVKKRFLSNMSHEIRTPMNGIIGMIDLMSTSNLNQEQKQYISTIKKSSETLLNILNDILDLSKIEAGKMELRLLPTSLQGVLEKLLALFKQNADSKNTILRLELDEDLPSGVMADETRLLQILSNLTSNAIKFTENGAVTIRCKLKNQENNDVQILFEVEDTGIGISEKHLQDLFKQFSQVDTSYTKSYGGTGLGLAISKELCKMMKGEIGVQSALNTGSIFWFTVKLTECDVELVEKRYKIHEKEVTKFDYEPSILVVDDNEVNRVVASTILRKVGCKVTIAESGSKALECILNETFDMVFMDIQMPEMNGITATKKINELNLDVVPPIIAMTAFSMKEEREEFLSAGMDDYVAKPIKADVLIGKVQQWYKKSEQELINGLNYTDKLKEETADLPIIDLKVPSELEVFGGKDLIEITYKEFETNGSVLIEQVKNSFTAKNREEIVSALHTLKGDAGTLGIQQVYKLAQQMEQNFKSDYKPDYIIEIDLLQDRFHQFQQNYKQILNL